MDCKITPREHYNYMLLVAILYGIWQEIGQKEPIPIELLKKQIKTLRSLFNSHNGESIIDKLGRESLNKALTMLKNGKLISVDTKYIHMIPNPSWKIIYEGFDATREKFYPGRKFQLTVVIYTISANILCS